MWFAIKNIWIILGGGLLTLFLVALVACSNALVSLVALVALPNAAHSYRFGRDKSLWSPSVALVALVALVAYTYIANIL